MKTVTINTLNSYKIAGEKFPVITAYDSAFARQIEHASIDVILVGDSLGNVILGYTSTVPVTMDDMLHHTGAVSRGNNKSLIVADMPYMSYATKEDTLANSARLMQAGAQMVKVEGGSWLEESVFSLSQRGVPVCGHLGLTPQSFNKLGGYKVQGRDEEGAELILRDAKALQEAGADMLVLECVPTELATTITKALDIPVVGIGAGPNTDAQVLVLYDMLGFSPRIPKFTKNFLAETNSVQLALQAYANAVRSGDFPQAEHGFK